MLLVDVMNTTRLSASQILPRSISTQACVVSAAVPFVCHNDRNVRSTGSPIVCECRCMRACVDLAAVSCVNCVQLSCRKDDHCL